MQANALKTQKRVVIVDDEAAARANLRAVIDSFDKLQLVGEFIDGQSAERALDKLRPDIAFLDIEMPVLNGFELARNTRHLNYQLVYLTAFEQYAFDAFNTEAIDYLLKPARPALIEKCIKKILRQELLACASGASGASANAHPGRWCLKEGASEFFLDHRHIVCIEGLGRYRRIHLSESACKVHGFTTIVSETTLDDMERQLGEGRFFRIHRSYIVNLDFVTAIRLQNRRHFIRLKHIGTELPIARSKLSHVKAQLQWSL